MELDYRPQTEGHHSQQWSLALPEQSGEMLQVDARQYLDFLTFYYCIDKKKKHFLSFWLIRVK